MDNPASVSDLTARGYTAPTGQESVGQTRLNEAWRALKREQDLRGIEDWITAGLLDKEDAADVIAAAALRVLRNPEGATHRDSAIDDWREGYQLADATQDIYFTSAEIRRLRPDHLTAALPGGSFPYSR